MTGDVAKLAFGMSATICYRTGQVWGVARGWLEAPGSWRSFADRGSKRAASARKAFARIIGKGSCDLKP
jgi:hypothetical protein